MITYPQFNQGMTVGVTAPSSGLSEELHGLLKLACSRLESMGFATACGETVWTQHKAKSAPAAKRASELNAMLGDDQTGLIIPPWGGELLIEILDQLDFDNMKPKWILGYSDISVLLLAVTLKTGIATAHGCNLVDMRGEYADETTGMWQTVLGTGPGESVVQHSSPLYQKEWDHENPSPCVFHLTEPTSWKTVGVVGEKVRLEGRLLGGCIDVIRHLVGTPYGDVSRFRQLHTNGEPVIWYLENCELSTVDLRRSLVQMRLAGWFRDCAGILFGRSPANQPVQGYTVEDVYADVAEELGIPVVYDIDCGHVPPQITFINGAYAEVEVAGGRGRVKQTFI